MPAEKYERGRVDQSGGTFRNKYRHKTNHAWCFHCQGGFSYVTLRGQGKTEQINTRPQSNLQYIRDTVHTGTWENC